MVQNAAGDILLGECLNRSAQGFWFAPGGRIQKNESLDAAFRRLTFGELGRAFERSTARLLDIYGHFYADSVFGAADADPDSHYVVLGYHLHVPADLPLAPPAEQHDSYRWWPMAEMQASSGVHDNSRAYLQALR